MPHSQNRLPGWMMSNMSTFAAIVAISAFGASLTPSLMPRDPLVQSLLSGIVASLGYEAALLVRATWRYMEIPWLRGRLRTVWVIGGLVACAGILAYSLSRAANWQNATREAVGLEPLESAAPFFILGVSLAVFLVLWLIFRALGIARRRMERILDRLVPRRVGIVVSIAAVGWLFWALVDGALIRNAFKAADASFMAADLLMEPDIEQPSDPQKTGSAASLIRWKEMGRHGRAFVATAPSSDEIGEFFEGPVQNPIRIYVGRLSAETAEERAEIALEELKRVDAFSRSTLVVAVPVGSGWMDPGAHDTLDFMLGGDVATVAAQYSYLTSVLSLLAHPDYGVDQARVLFEKVYDHWTTLPKDNRPEFYVHGLSQGAFNSQATIPLFDMLGDPIQGAMWAGSPFFSKFWSEVRDHRNPDSPAWRPTYGNGSLIRVLDQYGGLEGEFTPWGPIRMVFLNYGSDPIVNFTYDSSIFEPGWLSPPRAPDVTPQLRWFPVVTMLQLALDSAFSLNVSGFGHYYIARDYIDAWAAAVDPDGWTNARADRLKEIFVKRGASF
ncbi:alpha/beta-hydrolase family protein [Labrenzia sp. R4_1]|uniref:alpha/beta hydrolase n=1 Tax=Labrenzia sp. R4_1 TaxID=2821106 RepID=UPI001AD9C849|nr:alpha/beta-hydrolase family protein [Labrenzia sp. R4_1]MBO9426731.1 alpha/beta-hydrolase family protein [Labrenzia sp. R4_1]